MNSNDIKLLFSNLAKTFEEEKEHLGDLDAILGDGDHGVSMANGFAKASEAIQDLAIEDVGELFQTGGKALMSGIGGASGPLFAMVLIELGKASLGAKELSAQAFSTGVAGAAAAVQRLGKADVGDKTMLDVLFPVSEALEGIDSLEAAIKTATEAAISATEKTSELAAKKGRAQYVQGAGLGHPDPGATSLSIFFNTFYESGKSL